MDNKKIENDMIDAILKESEEDFNREREALKANILSKSKCMLDTFKDIVSLTEDTIKETGLSDVSDEFVLTRASMFFGMSYDKALEEKKEAAREEANRRHVEQQRKQNMGIQYPTGNSANPVMSMEDIEKMQAMNAQRGGVKSPCQERAERDKKIIEEKEAEIEKLSENK